MSPFAALGPLTLLVLGAILVLLWSAFSKSAGSSAASFGVALAALVAAGVVGALLWGRASAAFKGMLVLDGPALVFSALILLASVFVVLLGRRYVASLAFPAAEYYALLLLATAGLWIMVSSPHLVVIILGFEVTSISSYALAGWNRAEERSIEAAAKYFLLGGFAGAFLVFGIAVLYGATRSFDISSIAAAFGGPTNRSLLAWAGVGLVVSGISFKVAFVPFHMWAPDVYHGAPTPVTAFFVFAPKAAAMSVLFRILVILRQPAAGSSALFAALQAIAGLTIVVGTLAALRQANVKRMLAYSSIANSGYLLLAVLAGDGAGLGFFLAAYLFMSLGAFGVLAALAAPGREYHELEDFFGLAHRSPWIAGLLSVFLISLAGFPPTGGFTAKFLVFVQAARRGLTGLVVLAVLASLVSVYYYLRVVASMYMRSPKWDVPVDAENGWILAVLILCLLGILQLGIFPGAFLGLVGSSFPAAF
jgi:NADH-quinone oxidoreductase subunit N